MAYSYPIWNKVQACIYNSNKSYGVKETGETTICVGSSASNSHDFVDTCITKRIREYKGEDHIVFSYSVDGVIIKRAYFTINKRGKAETLVKTKTKLKSIKSL
jgi:hypothetical protein